MDAFQNNREMTTAVIFAQWLYKKGWSVRGGIGDQLIWVQREGYAWGEEPERLTTKELYERFEKEVKQ